jgi:hypothetical protein
MKSKFGTFCCWYTKCGTYDEKKKSAVGQFITQSKPNNHKAIPYDAEGKQKNVSYQSLEYEKSHDLSYTITDTKFTLDTKLVRMPFAS